MHSQFHIHFRFYVQFDIEFQRITDVNQLLLVVDMLMQCSHCQIQFCTFTPENRMHAQKTINEIIVTMHICQCDCYNRFVEFFSAKSKILTTFIGTIRMFAFSLNDLRHHLPDFRHIYTTIMLLAEISFPRMQTSIILFAYLKFI